MRVAIAVLCGGVLLSGCAGGGWPWQRDRAADAPVVAAPAAAPVAMPERRGGRLTPEGFDLTSQAERQAALAAGGGVLLGRTVASLGAPQEQGFWLRTGLVTSERAGRVQVPGTQTSVKVTLRPSGGSASAGSQLSLAAYRALGLPLTDLPTIEVFAGG